MKQAYNVSGIACSGCIENVTAALELVPGVRVIRVEKSAPQVEIEAEELPDLQSLQEALSKKGNYRIRTT